jgi:hypothetical protein
MEEISRLGMVAHTCNPSDSGGEDRSSRPAQVVLWETISQKQKQKSSGCSTFLTSMRSCVYSSVPQIKEMSEERRGTGKKKLGIVVHTCHPTT